MKTTLISLSILLAILSTCNTSPPGEDDSVDPVETEEAVGPAETGKDVEPKIITEENVIKLFRDSCDGMIYGTPGIRAQTETNGMTEAYYRHDQKTSIMRLEYKPDEEGPETFAAKLDNFFNQYISNSLFKPSHKRTEHQLKKIFDELKKNWTSERSDLFYMRNTIGRESIVYKAYFLLEWNYGAQRGTLYVTNDENMPDTMTDPIHESFPDLEAAPLVKHELDGAKLVNFFIKFRECIVLVNKTVNSAPTGPAPVNNGGQLGYAPVNNGGQTGYARGNNGYGRH